MVFNLILLIVPGLGEVLLSGYESALWRLIRRMNIVDTLYSQLIIPPVFKHGASKTKTDAKTLQIEWEEVNRFQW